MEQVDDLSSKIRKIRARGKKVCLTTGCFDILTIDHIRFLDFLSKNSDFVVIGLENDDSVKLNRGTDRPVNTYEIRKEILINLKSVDEVFEIPFTVDFNAENANYNYDELVRKLGPDFISTSSLTGKYLDEKRERAKKLGIGLLEYSKTSLL